MLTEFDWLRRAQTGAELLATLRCLATEPDLLAETELGPPHSALSGPCQRCWVYPRASAPSGRLSPYCKSCLVILAGADQLGHISRQAVVVWGLVNQLPRQLASGQGFHDDPVLGVYLPDSHHFLLMMPRHALKSWLQELLLYHGTELKGLLEVFPTTGARGGINMGDALCRAIHDEARFPLDQLRVRFFSAPHQFLHFRTREQLGQLTFEVSDFVSLLEMAAVFRTLMRPELQQALRQLLSLPDPSEAQFYWGRFLGYLSPEARDMLSAWRIRQWPRPRVDLLYELVEYVAFYETA